MYCIFNFYAICFLKFILYIMNYEIVKFEMVKLTRKEQADMVDTDVVVS
jgi:hypothetical protein